MLHDIGNVAADQCRILPNRKWLADEIALHRVAALLGEKAELLLRLYALGDDRHFQRMTEIDHGPDDCRRLRIAAEIDDKGAIDLDLVERERLQITQRRIAAAEIVQDRKSTRLNSSHSQ